MRCILGLLITYLFNNSVFFVHGGRVRKFLCSRRSPEHGKIEVKYRGRIAKFTCDPGYVLRGDKFATCLKGSWDSFPICERVGGCAYLETLEHGRVLISKDMSIIKFECDQGYKRSGGNGTLACKDFSWEKHKPTCEPDILRSCSFDEETICDWRNSTSSGFSWHLHQFRTPSRILNTGPSGDHTPSQNAAGHYLYIETSGGLYRSNDTKRVARIFSPMIFPMKGFETCFVFWYHMYGLTIGTLNVYVNNIMRFTKSGNQGDKWYRGLITNLPTNGTFVIEIEGVSGPDYLGDIAIDDVAITNSSECQKPMLIETTCRGRCYESEDNTTLCRCNPECENNDSCCLDFMHYCSLKSTTGPTEETTEEISFTSTENMLNSPQKEFSTIESDITELSYRSSSFLLSQSSSFEPELTTQSESTENLTFTEFTLGFSTSTKSTMGQFIIDLENATFGEMISNAEPLLNSISNNYSVGLLTSEMSIVQTDSETLPPSYESDKYTTTDNYLNTVGSVENHTHLQISSVLTTTVPKQPTSNSPLSTTEVTINPEHIKDTTPQSLTTILETNISTTIKVTKPPKKYYPKQTTIPHLSNKKWKSIYSPKGRYTFSAIKQEQTSTQLTYLSLILGVILLFTCLIGVGIYFFRRRQLRFSAEQEEADVIYLTSDEALDFNIGRR